MRRLIVCLALPLLLAGCQREPERDPFAMPGAVRLQVQTITFIDGQEMALRTRAGRALTQVEDPCGGPAGPTGMSYAWLNAEVIAAGHDPALTCEMAAPGYRVPVPPDRLPTPEERAARSARCPLRPHGRQDAIVESGQCRTGPFPQRPARGRPAHTGAGKQLRLRPPRPS